MVATVKFYLIKFRNVEIVDYMVVFCVSTVVFIYLDVPSDIHVSQYIYVSAVLIIFAFAVLIVSGVFMVVILPFLLFITVSACKV